MEKQSFTTTIPFTPEEITAPLSEAEQEYVGTVEQGLMKRFRKETWTRFTKAINTYEMIKDGDRIAVCISGGKDSMLMAKLFQELYRHGKRNFEVEYLVMDPGYNERNYRLILENARKLGIPIRVFRSEIFNSVADVGANPCYLCARMRRGYLYSNAKALGCNKIARLAKEDPIIEKNIFSSVENVNLATVIAYKKDGVRHHFLDEYDRD